MASGFLFVFKRLARDLGVQADETRHQRLVLRVFRDETLHDARIVEDGLQEFQVVVFEPRAAVDTCSASARGRRSFSRRFNNTWIVPASFCEALIGLLFFG